MKRAHVVDPARTFFRRVVEDDDVVRHHIVARRFVKGRVDVPVAGHANDAHALKVVRIKIVGLIAARTHLCNVCTYSAMARRCAWSGLMHTQAS